VILLGKKNPVIEKAKKEGYEAGFKAGAKFGQENAVHILASKFEGLEKVNGIGPKTLELVVRHFGSDYFKELEE
jgi:hypothetical protein